MKIIPIICLVVIIIAVFILLREFFCWYWKINQTNKMLEKNNELLSKILSKISGDTDLFIPPVKEKINVKKKERIEENPENYEINQLRKNLREDEVLVKIKHNGKIEVRKKSDIEESLKEGRGDKFSIIE